MRRIFARLILVQTFSDNVPTGQIAHFVVKSRPSLNNDDKFDFGPPALLPISESTLLVHVSR